jgi:hypothetical protein
MNSTCSKMTSGEYLDLRIDASSEWKISCNKELCDLYNSSSIVRVMKSVVFNIMLKWITVDTGSRDVCRI